MNESQIQPFLYDKKNFYNRNVGRIPDKNSSIL